MRYPEFLGKDGRLGFIAPSFSCATEPYASCYKSAKEFFSARGYNLVEGENCARNDGIGKSSTAENCAAEINEFFTADKCDAVISCGGGETMCEDLPLVDFAAIAGAKPKWFMGYSDNTNLVFTLPTLCDTAAIYGPCASSFGMRPRHESIVDAVELLEGKKLTVHSYDGWESAESKDDTSPTAPYNITEPENIKLTNCAPGDTFSGRLLGGCLDCLQLLCGTQFDAVGKFNEKYGGDGIIWFIEACDLNPFGVRRALWQLENAGWFEKTKAFLIGRPLHYNESFGGMDMENAVLGILEKYAVPVIRDIDLGHLPPMMPLINGAMADVTAGDNTIKIRMRLE